MVGAYAVLTAAGSGTRLGAGLPKALVEVRGKPLLRWALESLIDSGSIQAICVTAPEEHLDDFLQETLLFDFPISVVRGGVSRQSSVRRGLLGLEETVGPIPEDSVVLVHDAARCFAPAELIKRLVDIVESGVSAVVPGLPVADTIKQVTAGEGELAMVTSTPDRRTLRSVQTPQAFRWNLLRRAHEELRTIGMDEATAVTDDATLIEMLGEHVWVCAGDPLAAKITTTEDLSRVKTRWGHR